jgi:crotonobetainyl-CoA:carnitine CoA-transferase CaiB-like acyl-CoA transferase
MSISGLLDQIGPVGSPPTIPGIQFTDMADGGMNRAIGILSALVSRERTGERQYVDISMTDSMVSFLPVVHRLHKVTGAIPRRSQSILSHDYACYKIYETSDRKYFSVGALIKTQKENLTLNFFLNYSSIRIEMRAICAQS